MKNIAKIVFSLILCSLFLAGSKSQTDSRVEIYDLRSHTHPSFTRIVVDIGKLREYHFSQLPSPDRVFVDVYQAKLNPILHGKSTSVENGYVKQIRIAQKNPTTVRVVVDLDLEKIKRYQVWHIFDPFRIVIDIYPQSAAPDETAEKVAQPAQPTKSGYSIARQLGLGINRIVIDPGHGGKDPGCIGRKGAREKDVVLDVSSRLKKLLTAGSELEVILTRESDIFIPVENRPVIANQKQADLFISIHANSNPRKNRSDPSVIAIAATENATSSKNISDMQSILRKIVRNVKIEESQDLAGIIQSSLVKSLKKSYSDIKDLGVKGGPFWVLIGGDMPSILVEISHLSNLQEESRLKTAEYRQQIAQGIYEGILKYLNSLGKG